MKKYIPLNKKTLSLLFVFGCYLFSGCDKSLEEVDYPALNPVSLDETGGNYKAILTSPEEITVLEPMPVTSSEYASELNNLKTLSSNLSTEQKNAVKYWGAGGVLRWNEIIRELIAKYNLAAASSPEGTYPIPDALKPTTYPEFPFTNPPYSARALALLSVAQYDALVAAWRYKYLYNRSAPYKMDNAIVTSLPKSDLPSYPSEDAVIASVSFELLKFLFPGEVNFLQKKAEEHKQSRIWAGVNVMSDIAAGDSLGKKIASRVIAYGKNDGMKSAGAFTLDMKTACEQKAKTDFGLAWKSLETPARPPMLPSYGAAKNWLFDNTVKIAIRPEAPPKIGSVRFEQDMDELRKYSKSVTREQRRIVAYWADGTGTYTPPGHWNAIAAGLVTQNKFSEIRTARTFALMNIALHDAGICCWETKYFYYIPRPSSVDPKIKTATGVPNFPSYTSGHATFSGAASTVLSYLFPSEKTKLEGMATEAAMSRVYGGIHYKFDSDAGLKCGKEIGQFAVEKGKLDGSIQ